MSHYPELTRQELADGIRTLGIDTKRARSDIRRLLFEATSLLRAREQAIGRKKKDRFHQSVANASRQLRRLLADGPPYAVAELWEEGLRWCTPLPPECGPPSGSHYDIHWLTDQLQRIEDVAEKATNKMRENNQGGRRPQRHRGLIAELAVHTYLQHHPDGRKTQAHQFTGFVHQAAVLRIDPDDASKPRPSSDTDMRRHVDRAWAIYRTKLDK